MAAGDHKSVRDTVHWTYALILGVTNIRAKAPENITNIKIAGRISRLVFLFAALRKGPGDLCKRKLTHLPRPSTCD